MSTETLEFTPAADELLLHTYAEGAYLDYAMSVVKDRALGQVQDGNKPVHRRILYAMRQLGLTHDAKAVKCARIVGDVLGKYHPHGDTAAYDALVRLAQPFSLRYPLITGQGNFGSPDGDGAAAMRYTEAKLAPISSLLLDEMGAGTVDYKPNYDGSQQEPVLLPARLPFMLLNGTMGIAVGMASNIPPHNLRDVVAAAVAVLANPDIGAAELLTHLPGPDFPGGGQLISSSQDIATAYEAGRGSLRLRARWVREELARGQWQIVVKELPYQVSTKQVLEEIETLSNPQVPNGKKALTQQQLNLKQLALDFLETARDESGKDDAVRLVLVPRNSKVDETAMMAFLLANTGLEDTFGVNATMIGLDGNPATKGVLTVLREWCVFRTDTVRRRCAWELDQAEKRIHVLEGRMTVYLNLDAVIKVIREADEPKDELMARFALSEVQATDILDMRLRALNKLEGIRIEKELSELRAESARLRALLDSEPALRDLVTREIQADGAKYGDERRTLIKPESRAAGATAIARAVTDEPVTVIVSKNLWVRARAGHGLDPATLSYRTGDEQWHVIETRTSRSLAVMDNTGRSYSVRVSDIPSARGDGAPLTAFIDLQPGARILHALSLAESDELLFASEAGYGLKAPFKSLLASKRAGKEFLDMELGILPHAPVPVKEGAAPKALCISGDGRMLAFPADEIKTLAAGGKGVKLMELGEAKLTHFGVFEGDAVTLEMELKGKEATVTVKGAELDKYVLHRSRKGCALPKKGVVKGFSGA